MTRATEDHQVTDGPTQPNGCHVERVEKPVDQESLNRSSVAIFRVSGMGCPNCATRVQNGLLRHTEVVRALVSLEKGLAWVNFDAKELPVQDLVDAVAQAGLESGHGYEAHVIEVIH